MRDLITVSDLELRSSSLQVDHWQRPSKEQPLVCTLSIRTDVDSEAEHDDLLQDSLNYGTVTKEIEQFVAELDRTEQDLPLEFVAEEIAKVVLFRANAPNVHLSLRRPRALLTADCIGVSITRARSDYSQPRRDSASLGSQPRPLLSDYALLASSKNPLEDTFFVKGLRRYIIIGLNPCEREDEQEVIVDLDFYAESHEMINNARVAWSGWRGMVKQLENVSAASYPTNRERTPSLVNGLLIKIRALFSISHLRSHSRSSSSRLRSLASSRNPLLRRLCPRRGTSRERQSESPSPSRSCSRSTLPSR